MLGVRKLLLVGCDFGAVDPTRPRSRKAHGYSPRDLRQPVRGNLGRTVFADEGLLMTHELFERMIDLVGGLNVVRLGEGVFLKNAINSEADDALACAFKADRDRLHEIMQQLPPAAVNREVWAQFVKSADDAIQEVCDNIVGLVNDADEWNHQLALSLASCISRDQPALPPHQRYAHAMLAQPSFFLLRLLYDAPPQHWNGVRSLIVEAMQYLSGVFRCHSAMMASFMQFNAMPVWDHQWMRARYRALESS